ncbi:MAG: ATP-binding protein [Anaerolineales bacterium]
MDAYYQEIINILTTSPGNFAYHIIVAFSVAGALQISINHWRESEFPQQRRIVIGLGLLLSVRLVLFFVVGLTWQGLGDPRSVLPVLDRGITTLSLILIIWLWAFPEPLRLADAITSLLSLATIVFLIFSFGWWNGQKDSIAFNASWLETGWQSLAVFFLAIGALIILIRKPNGWGSALSMILLSFAGHLTDLIYPILEGDFPGAVRLAQLAAYPLLLALPRRFLLPSRRLGREREEKLVRDRRRYGVEPQTFNDLLTLATQASLPEAYRLIARAVSHTMLADICLIFGPEDEQNHIEIICGYDLIREQYLPTESLSSQSIPVISEAMERRRPLRLPASSTSRDLAVLRNFLELTRPGHLLAIPVEQGDKLLFEIILLTPHSNRGWNKEDQSILKNAAESLAQIMQQSQQSFQIDNSLTKPQAMLKDKVAHFEATHQEIKEDLESLLPWDFEGLEEQEFIENLIEANQESQQLITQLRSENRKLQDYIKGMPSQSDTSESEVVHLEEELRLTLEEVARLRSSLAQSDEKLLILQSEQELLVPLTDEQVDVVTSLVQDFRQPMSSILGYTDLLLSESVGILGALQIKFLERIKASIGRLMGLLDDLIQITSLDRGGLDISPQVIDIHEAIDTAISQTSSQLQEKDIILDIDVPDRLPRLHADRDALFQVLIHLLQNASTATPEGGEVYLRAKIQKSDYDEDFILLQVTDRGGGIPVEDLPRVFSRLYRADNPLIQGIGDTGVGLSITKALVEAQGGRIWVDSELGIGSTFSLVLPAGNHNDAGRKKDASQE